MTNKINILVDTKGDILPPSYQFSTYEEALAYLNKLRNEGFFRMERDVLTPIATGGHPIFNKNRQIFYVDTNGLLNVLANMDLSVPYKDRASLFKWVNCNREDLVVGDVAYGTSNDTNAVLDDFRRVFVVLDAEEYWCISDNLEPIIDSVGWSNWYKLEKR